MFYERAGIANLCSNEHKRNIALISKALHYNIPECAEFQILPEDGSLEASVTDPANGPLLRTVTFKENGDIEACKLFMAKTTAMPSRWCTIQCGIFDPNIFNLLKRILNIIEIWAGTPVKKDLDPKHYLNSTVKNEAGSSSPVGSSKPNDTNKSIDDFLDTLLDEPSSKKQKPKPSTNKSDNYNFPLYLDCKPGQTRSCTLWTGNCSIYGIKTCIGGFWSKCDGDGRCCYYTQTRYRTVYVQKKRFVMNHVLRWESRPHTEYYTVYDYNPYTGQRFSQFTSRIVYRMEAVSAMEPSAEFYTEPDREPYKEFMQDCR